MICVLIFTLLYCFKNNHFQHLHTRFSSFCLEKRKAVHHHKSKQRNNGCNKTLSLSYIAKPTELTIDKAITRVLESKTYGIFIHCAQQ